MKRLSKVAAALWLMAAPLAAQESPVVVELFTSQGCSSCPPADELMHRLAERDDVIALALHVDYWDYIGWKDEFADPRNAERQRAYARLAGRRSIYTPEMIVNGTTDIVGAKPMEVSNAIAAHKEKPAAVQLTLSRAGDEIRIDAAPLTGVAGPMIVQMLRYVPEREARITRGENAGRTITYANVTQDWKVLREWDGRAPLKITAQVTGEEPVVVLVQASKMGPILAAGELK
ncbi:DUF1223 domain-containing protein [Roseobacter sinensis]|uniref:DUF1223 domain-containing protein n=1 Tax=Roseobacter sinensis TaxID=2931391 RepID=A0ABT3BDH0_9RHOB|nr:DUF1223 domain-containing protein [Roseobacter sp. WL0113]MCV3271184.1 DUF1223 domain-containing protein [Roseobacter sp. WL0113]